MSRKPPVGKAKWQPLIFDRPSSLNYWDERAENGVDINIYVDGNKDNDPYGFFLKVVMTGLRPKYFYGETAYSDAERYVADNGGGWISL
jgi:hypothetical protein